MTLAEFANVFGILALQLRCTDADEAMIRAYFVALQDLPLELVQLAAVQFASQMGDNGAWFPKTAEWKAAARKVEAERVAIIEETLRKRRQVRQPLCFACEDTSWVPGPDNRVTRCSCREQRRLEAIGRRPLPALPSALELPTDLVAAEKIQALVQQLANKRHMPRVRVRFGDTDAAEVGR